MILRRATTAQDEREIERGSEHSRVSAHAARIPCNTASDRLFRRCAGRVRR
jgi:hypothetical protein